MEVSTFSPPAPAAPAQPAASEPTTIAASEAAVSKSPREYREARRAERFGKPLPAVAVEATPAPVETKADPAAAAPAQPQLSRKEREQHDANERTRKAVEAATADIRAELDRVKASAAPRSEPAAPVTPAPTVAPVEKFPSIEEWSTKNPDKGLEDYIDARSEFQQEQKTTAARIDSEMKARAEDLTKRGQAFANAITEAVKAEPDLASKIPPAMRDPQASRPLSALSPEEMKTAKFSNLVAEAAFRAANGGSGKPGELLKFLHANQAETVRIAEIARTKGTYEALIALERLDERLAARTGMPAPTVAKPTKTKTITSAPAPQETLGTRPAESVDPLTAAVKSGDTRAYREQRRAERAQQLGRR